MLLLYKCACTCGCSRSKHSRRHMLKNHTRSSVDQSTVGLYSNAHYASNALKQPSFTINRCHDNLCFKQLLTWPLNEDGLHTYLLCERGFLLLTQMKQHPLLCSKAHSWILSYAKQEGLQVHPVIKYTLRDTFSLKSHFLQLPACSGRGACCAEVWSCCTCNWADYSVTPWVWWRTWILALAFIA